MTTFSKVYGSTTNASYSGTVSFQTTSTNPRSVIVNNASYIIPANTNILNVTISLSTSNNNTVAITSSLEL
jgi:hypothetical protein